MDDWLKNASAQNDDIFEEAGMQAPGASLRAAAGLSLTCSSVALLLNSLLMLALLRGRVRERCSGMVMLTAAELQLNLLLTIFLLSQLLMPANSVPDELGDCVHASQTARNWWMLTLTTYRTVITVRPQLATQPERQFPGRHQAGLMLAIVSLCGCELLLGSAWSLGDAALNGNASTSGNVQVMRLHLFKNLNYAALGTLLPGFCVLCLACRIVQRLRARYSNHRGTNRAARTILLLSVGFVLLEFPYALSNAATVIYLLKRLTRLPLTKADFHILALLEHLVTWGMAVVPINSCLNFFILLRYSRSFRELLHRGDNRHQQHQLRLQRLQQRQQRQRQQRPLEQRQRCEAVAMLERRNGRSRRNLPAARD